MRVAPLALLLLAACRSDPPTPKGRSWPTPPLEPADGGLVATKLPRIAHRGGPFLENPRVATITWTQDDPALVARLETFGDTITRTAWWRAVVDSFCTPKTCIGEGSAGLHLHIDEPLPEAIHDLDLEAILEKKVGAVPPGTLLLVYPPPGVVVSDAFVPHYCNGGPRAYHRRTTTKKIPFAVMPRCTDEAALTSAASHELLEATTNPDPAAHGFAFEQTSATLGFTSSGVEPVDPCGVIHRDAHWTKEGAFAVQRAWSNRAAALGHEPCVPAPADRPYLALVPREPALRLAKVGDRGTVLVDAVADRTVSEWSIQAIDLTGTQQQVNLVDVSFDRTTIRAGESATLTVTLKSTNAGRLGIVGAVSRIGNDTWMWPIPVVMR